MCTTMAKRAGTTVKVSISIDKADLAILRKRADKAFDGNVSAAVAELVAIAREQQGRQAVLDWLAEVHPPSTKAELDAIRAEWAVPRPRRRTKAA